MLQKKKLYIACCSAMLVVSLSFSLRAGVLDTLGLWFELNHKQLSSIASTAFLGFPISVLLGGWFMDHIKPKIILILTFSAHLLGVVMIMFSGGYHTLWFSTLLIGFANGLVVAVCNPLIAQLYPNEKTTKFNYFYLWFPLGLYIGSMIVFFFQRWGIEWYWQLSFVLLPLFIYGYLFFILPIPFVRLKKTDGGVVQFKSFFSPKYLFFLLLMMGMAITEYFPNQWVNGLLRSVHDDAILVLFITSGVMVLGRLFTPFVVKKLNPLLLLTISSFVSFVGLVLLAHADGLFLFVSAFIFGLGICYFSPTMIALVSDHSPNTGALGIAIVYAVGMLAVSFYTTIMGEYYDSIVLAKLPVGSVLQDYQEAEKGSVFALQYTAAKRGAGPEVLSATLLIPLILTLVFALFWAVNRKRKPKYLDLFLLI